MFRVRSNLYSRLPAGWWLAFFLFACAFDPRIQREEPLAPPAEQLDITVQNFNTRSYDRALLKWNLQARAAGLSQKKQRTFLTNVTIVFYDADERVVSSAKSKEAVLENDSQNITLLNQVVMRNVKGTKVSGEYFYWNNTTEKLTSPREVVIKRKDGAVLKGEGFAADQNFENITFASKVRGQLKEGEASQNDFFDGF